jgi:uncharacterized protein
MMNVYALRLNPGEDLKDSLQMFAQAKDLQAGFILTTVGSLSQAAIRFAGQPNSRVITGAFEIVSLVGTLSPDDVHLHISISDKEGRTIGGHVSHGCIVRTTAEIVLGNSLSHQFMRTLDEQTGYWELEVKHL